MAVHGPMICAFASLLLLAVGCGDDASGEASAAREEIVRGTGAEPLRAVTEDGVEVILASKRQADRRNREREQRLDLDDIIREPNEPDPHGGEFTLEEAVEGMPIDGQLVAEIRTDLGTIFCDLHADRVPKTVANFIGLARGKRAFWNARAGAWVAEQFYHGTTFHRVIPEFAIQAGDYLGDGSAGVGYVPEWDTHPTLTSHDRAGQLCMASSAENPNGGQFFITDGRAARLDGDYPIFGQCEQTDIVERIARVPQDADDDNRPRTDVVIDRILIRRIPGGAALARSRPPAVPAGFDPNQQVRGASPGPIEQANELQERIRAAEEERRGGGHAGHGH